MATNSTLRTMVDQMIEALTAVRPGEVFTIQRIGELLGVRPETMFRWYAGVEPKSLSDRLALRVLHKASVAAMEGNQPAKSLLARLLAQDGPAILGRGYEGVIDALGYGFLLCPPLHDRTVDLFGDLPPPAPTDPKP